MLSTVYRLYPLSDFCQNIGLKLTSCNQENGTGRLLHLLMMPREKEVEKLCLTAALTDYFYDQCKHALGKVCDFLLSRAQLWLGTRCCLTLRKQKMQERLQDCKTYKVYLLPVTTTQYLLNWIGQPSVWP